MTSVETNHPQRRFAEFSQLHLNVDDELCGEVFITLGRTLKFHCTICASNFGSYDYFLNHLAKHYEDGQGEVIEIDAEIKTSEREINQDIETHFEDNSLDKQIEEQDSVKYESDNSDYEYEKILQKVVHIKPKFEIEEVFLEETYSRTNSEHTVEEFEEFNVEKIADKIEIEEHTSYTQFLDEQASDTKNNIPPRRKDRQSFSCEECGKAFKTNQKLRRHYVTHSDERKYQCKTCGFAFKARRNLDAHVRRHGLKTISCGYCSKKFFTTKEAQIHRRTHTGERPFVCPTCGMAFSNASGLHVHAKRHYSEPDNKCKFCGKGFYVKAHLQHHLVVHTKEKNFVCEICAATFPRHNSWMRHAKMHERM